MKFFPLPFAKIIFQPLALNMSSLGNLQTPSSNLTGDFLEPFFRKIGNLRGL